MPVLMVVPSRAFKATGSHTHASLHRVAKKGGAHQTWTSPILLNICMCTSVDICDVCNAGGGAILLVLSPGLSGLCLGIFTVLWGFTIMYGSYSRHSQRVVQVWQGTGRS